MEIGADGELQPTPPRAEALRRRAVRELKEYLDLAAGDDVRVFSWWVFWLGAISFLKWALT